MKHAVDPQQNWLFDPALSSFSDLARQRLIDSWPGVFRTCILELMPTEEVGKHFSESMGRPTKELYSACGLLLLMEFNDWTVEKGADAYMFDARVQFALNLGRDCQSMSTRTVERYQAIFREEEMAQTIMDRVISRLVELLEINIETLRLDSTHVFSNMASFGRRRLMMTVTRRFLTQVKRHNSESYLALSEELRDRYAKKAWEFSKGSKDCGLSAQELAEDMHFLMARYEDDSSVNDRPSFKDLVRVFSEQCEVCEDKVTIRKKTGGNVMQNPSDPDATFDGKKGQGYQVQAAETCSDKNETQLIVSAIAQTACEHDQNAVEKVVDDLEQANLSPSVIVADAAYGGDKNYRACQEKGIKLTAPVIQGTLTKGRIELTEFSFNDDGSINACPKGYAPLKAWFDIERDRGAATFSVKHCQTCPLLQLCQAKKNGKNYQVYYNSRSLRIVERKLDMRSAETKADYAKRSAIEGTFSMAKCLTGLDRLRVRGKRAVFMAILLRMTGVNIHRAAATETIRKRVKEALAELCLQYLPKYPLFTALCAFLRPWRTPQHSTP